MILKLLLIVMINGNNDINDINYWRKCVKMMIMMNNDINDELCVLMMILNVMKY